jgi:hypothetical protein
MDQLNAESTVAKCELQVVESSTEQEPGQSANIRGCEPSLPHPCGNSVAPQSIVPNLPHDVHARLHSRTQLTKHHPNADSDDI